MLLEGCGECQQRPKSSERERLASDEVLVLLSSSNVFGQEVASAAGLVTRAGAGDAALRTLTRE